MILKTIGAILIAGSVMMTPVQDKPKEKEWKSLGEYRITVFCQHCNDPGGYQSKSGKPLEYGDVAMNDVPLGSQISVDGEVFTVTDRCGVGNTVDIFIPTDADYCPCNTLEYKEVYIKE